MEVYEILVYHLIRIYYLPSFMGNDLLLLSLRINNMRLVSEFSYTFESYEYKKYVSVAKLHSENHN